MAIRPYTDNIKEFLAQTGVIDHGSASVAQKAMQIAENAGSGLEYIRAAYEFVRDCIAHSADVGEDAITCSASEVLRAGHGICFAKSHLLAALLRCRGIPAGFCYQKLILDDETAPVLILHGLNGVYIGEIGRWIRLDARGNKEGVNAQFSLESEQLAFPVRPELGEEDGFVVYPDPDPNVLERMKKFRIRSALFGDLPTELAVKVD